MLSPELIEQLVQYATYKSPFEMCGLLFSGSGFISCQNTAEKPTREFKLEREEYESACRIFKGTPWALVHSHPGKSAAPSLQDCQLMDAFQLANVGLEMVIVGLNPVEIRCFKKVGDNYPLQWAYRMRDGTWCGPGMGEVLPWSHP